MSSQYDDVQDEGRRSMSDRLPDDIVELREEQRRIAEGFSYLSPVGGFLLFGAPLMCGVIIFIDMAGIADIDVVRYVIFGVVGLIVVAFVIVMGVALFHPKAQQLRQINRAIRDKQNRG